MIVKTLTVGPFQENCYLVGDGVTRDAVLVDPGDEPVRLIAAVEQGGWTLRALWITHGHIDHVGGIAAVKRQWNVPVYLHPAGPPVVRSRRRAGGALRPSHRAAAAP